MKNNPTIERILALSSSSFLFFQSHNKTEDKSIPQNTPKNKTSSI